MTDTDHDDLDAPEDDHDPDHRIHWGAAVPDLVGMILAAAMATVAVDIATAVDPVTVTAIWGWTCTAVAAIGVVICGWGAVAELRGQRP